MANNTIFSEQEESLEIMEFMIGKNHYGLNIAKVREVVKYTEVVPSPDQDPCIEGILMLRGEAIPIINLAKRLSVPDMDDKERNLFIITNFNKLTVGLHVHTILGIRRLSWKDIKKPDETLLRHGNSIITGIINLKDIMIVQLDFEKIVADINPRTTITLSDIKENTACENSDKPIMIVDDSPMLISLIKQALTKAGYKNIICYNDGEQAYNAISDVDDKSKIQEHFALVVTDIEMPVMDGLTLCKKLKNENFVKQIPVILFSSIITGFDNDSMNQRGKEVGADAWIAKPMVAELVEQISTLI